jgi:hypothetical protein
VLRHAHRSRRRAAHRAGQLRRACAPATSASCGANPTLRGGLTAQLKINTSGHLDAVQVSTGMSSRPLVNCVKAALMRVSFPPSRGGCALAEVRYNFTPRE